MTYEDIIHNLENKIYHPIYFLMGEEPYYIDKITDFILENILIDAEKSFNQTILYGKDTDIETVIITAKRFPMMAAYQVVVVKEAQHIKKIELLEKYLNAPLETTILVINYKYGKVDKRKAFAKQVKQKGVLFESPKMRDYQLSGWITNYLKNRNYSITPQGGALLAEYLGADLSKLVNEIEKLIISLPENTQITSDMIEKNIGISKEYNIFELQNALGEKDVLKANRIINFFGANPSKYPMVRTVVMLYYFYLKLLKYHFLKDRSDRNVASVLQIQPYFVKSYTAAARKYTIRTLVEIIALLREFDMKSKGVGSISVPESELQKELIYKILH